MTYNHIMNPLLQYFLINSTQGDPAHMAVSSVHGALHRSGNLAVVEQWQH